MDVVGSYNVYGGFMDVAEVAHHDWMYLVISASIFPKRLMVTGIAATMKPYKGVQHLPP